MAAFVESALSASLVLPTFRHPRRAAVIVALERIGRIHFRVTLPLPVTELLTVALPE
jgi:hypothetical protein